MLVRLIIKNLFSFNEATEFNLLPGRFSRMPYHVQEIGDVALLKLSVIYGANGAGKSNLIKVLALLADYLRSGQLPVDFLLETFKFEPDSRKKDVYIGVEFIKNEMPFYYGITLNQGMVIEEELYYSGAGKEPDVLLFRRTDQVGPKRLRLEFAPVVLKDPEAAIFPEFLENEVLERDQPVLYHMASRKNIVFEPYKWAHTWFTLDFVPILPATRPSGLPILLEKNDSFRKFSCAVMDAFDTGIKDIKVDTIPVEEFFGQEGSQHAERITAQLRAAPEKVQPLVTEHEEITFVLRGDKAVAKRLYFLHDMDGGTHRFAAAEESDGTRRLLDYLPAFYAAINSQRVYMIDEIERSIHPLLIKELIQKFSHDEHTKGQLIFSTHESNLLDQDIFRPDEIWFAEKDKGATKLSPLSDYREHHTIDIRRGYLNGRYSAIPFLANLRDLNWDTHAEAAPI